MSTTPNMSLTLPEVLVTSGPTYATQVNTALDVVDDHDHSVGKGKKITPTGLNINSDLTLNINQLVDVKAVKLSQQASVATLGAIYVKGADLFYRDLNGLEVQLTSSGAINTSSTGAITGLGGTTGVASYVSASGLFNYQSNPTTYAQQYTGDISLFSRAGIIGVVQAIKLQTPVAATAYTLTLPATAPAANQIMRMENTAGQPGKFVDVLGTANQVTVTHNASDITLSLPQSIDSSATPTFGGLTLTGGLTGTAVNVTGQVDCDTVVGLTSVGAPLVYGNSATFTGNLQGADLNISGDNFFNRCFHNSPSMSDLMSVV